MLLTLSQLNLGHIWILYMDERDDLYLYTKELDARSNPDFMQDNMSYREVDNLLGRCSYTNQ